MTIKEEAYDVVVVGAGPGGATASALIAMRGHRVLLIEKESLPVYKIGESLLPSTIHGVCAILGVQEELKAANFVRKLGGTFRWGRNKEPWTFAFAASSEFAGPTSYAYQVERMKFDTILVNNARRKGVDVRECVTAREAIVENGRIAGLHVVDAAGKHLEVSAKYVVDASGHGSWLARHAGERVHSPFFRNLAVFGYYLNGKRLPPPNSGNIFCAAFDKGWFWYIPLSAELTSVGAVIGEEHGAVLRQDKEAALTELISQCEPVRSLLGGAWRVKDGPYGEVRTRKDFSYCHTAFWRPGLVLVGDAACFIDPVFSSGVHLATYSGLLAARSINTCLTNSLREDQVFTEFERRYMREYRNFHDFLMAFYDLEQDLDAYYWAARKVLNAAETGGEAFIRLVGGIGGSGEPMAPIGDERAPGVQLLARHLFPAAVGNADMYIDTASASSDDTRDVFMKSLTAESVDMQLQGMRIPMRYRPLFHDGLTVSNDGLSWVVPAIAPANSRAERVNASRGTNNP